jgi:predicted DNA-binding transcriptional regulator AlpA
MAEDTDWLAIAEELDAMKEAHDDEAALASVFRDAPSAAVVGMWSSGKHWKTGKLLTERQRAALVEVWCTRFDRLPPSELASRGDGVMSVPLDQHALLSVPDDAMLRPRDVLRLFGYAKSTLKRHVASGKFPRPQHAAPGQRFVAWPARQLKAWLLSEGRDGSTRH